VITSNGVRAQADLSRGGISTVENQASVCILLALRLGTQGLQWLEWDRQPIHQPDCRIGHHPGEENQMTLVTDRTVLTQEADQLSMQLDTGCHANLVSSWRSGGSNTAGV